tara:strand:- start:31 stop:747 length:717 start_codon:yes stop_codon:yes gene_type:complete
MSNYTKTTNFLAKDSLPDNDTAKIIRGSEFETEFTNLVVAVASKANIISQALTGIPTTPTAAPGTNTLQIASTAFVTTAANAAFPTGGIIMWSGTLATIPVGWLLCNGSNSTPDLRNRFVIGASQDDGGYAKTTVTGSPLQTGGNKDAVVVEHNHGAGTLVTAAAGSHNHYSTGGANGQGGGNDGNQVLLNPYSSPEFATSTVAAHTHTISGSTADFGVTGTNANLPPYYALAYIMKS